MAKCVVSFVGADRVRHSVTVYAGGVLEAAGLALVAFGSQEEEWMSGPGAGATLEVEVHAPPVTHAVTVDRVTTWLGSSGNPIEMATKNRIRRSLETQRRGQPSHS
jgi:hypothetical protein